MSREIKARKRVRDNGVLSSKEVVDRAKSDFEELVRHCYHNANLANDGNVSVSKGKHRGSYGETVNYNLLFGGIEGKLRLTATCTSYTKSRGYGIPSYEMFDVTLELKINGAEELWNENSILADNLVEYLKEHKFSVKGDIIKTDSGWKERAHLPSYKTT